VADEYVGVFEKIRRRALDNGRVFYASALRDTSYLILVRSQLTATPALNGG
jgi:hypothetical protein